MQKKLLSGLLWVLLLNLLVKPLWIFGIEVGVQNAVGAEEYGFYFAAFNLAYIFNILLDLGITNFNTRSVAQQPGRVMQRMRRMLPLKLVLLGVYLVVTLVVGLLLPDADARGMRLLVWICINQFLSSMLIYLRSNFEGLLMFRADSVLSVVDRVLMIIICGGLLLHARGADVGFRVEWFVGAQTAAYLLAVGTAWVMLRSKVGRIGLEWSGRAAATVLRKSMPYAVLVLLMAAYNRVDAVMLRAMLPNGNYESGIYAAAFRMLDALTMVAYLVSVPLLPVFARMTAAEECGEDDRGELGDTVWLVFEMLLVYAVVAVLTCVGAAGKLMQLFYGNGSMSALCGGNGEGELVQVFSILTCCLLPICFTYVFGTLLTAGGQLRRLNVLAAISLVISVGLNALLIPRWGCRGSAVAGLVAQGFMAVAQLVVAMRLYAVRPVGRVVWRMAAYVVLCVGGLLAVQVCWPAGNLGVWCCYALGAVLLAVAMRLIDFKRIAKIMMGGNAGQPNAATGVAHRK